MTKQEMAVWLAVSVLGWNRCEQKWHIWMKDFEYVMGHKGHPLLCDFIYSPDGFFAVWDKCLEEGFQSIEIEVLNVEPDGQETWQCTLYDHSALGKDRYEAFYNAVYEAMKEDK